MKKSLLLFAAAAMATAAYCQKSNELSNLETIKFDFDKATKTFDIKTLFNSVSYEVIALETTDACLIGEVSKIVFRNDTIFVADKTTKSLFIFNDKGKYLSKICRTGRARQEYTDLSDVFIANDHILVLDQYQNKVCCYDFNGQFRYAFDTQEGMRIYESDGMIFVCSLWSENNQWGNHQMVAFNSTGNIVSSYFKMTEADTKLNDYYNYFIPKGNGFEHVQPSTNIVYTYANGKFTPSYKIDFGNKVMPVEIAKKGLFYVTPNGLNKSYCFGVDKIEYLDRYRIITSEFNSKYYYLVYDTVEKTTKAISTRIKCEGMLWANNRFINANQIYYYLDAGFIFKFYKEGWKMEPPQSDVDKLLYEATKNLADDDNGVIVRGKFIRKD